ncbi:uncharacterized protein [Primulina eburnea]|uniref:uncharacterized protein n=1 Tax=Primulina eburnea TaxID=1245227 RepID=UPI003C6C4694
MEDNKPISLEELDGNYDQEDDEQIEQHVVENFEVQNENSVVDVLKSKLLVGTVVNSVEDAYLLYCQYAHAKGFSVRKGDQRCFSHTNELQSKEIICSCEGSKDERNSSKKILVYQKLITRTNCKAKLKITREKESEWRVSRFVEEHNHEMFASDQNHLLRSACNISHAKKSTLEAMVNVGISVSNVVSFMEHEAYKTNKENYFYWNVQLDDDDRVMNFFFRDYRCAVDYENSMIRHVMFNKQSREIKCNCCKFETMGILCKHVLMVFNCMDFTVIPKCYILRRWMKNIKGRVSTDLQETGSGGGDGGAHVSQMEFVNQIMRSVYDLSQLSKPYECARKTLYTLVDTAKDEISNFVQNLSINEQCDDDLSEDQIGKVCIRNPLTAKAKGITNANITRHWDHTSKKGKR